MVFSSLVDQELSEREIVAALCAQGFTLSKTTVHRRLQALRSGSCSTITTKPKYNRKLTPRTLRYTTRQIRFHNNRTTAGLQQDLRQHGYQVSTRTLLRHLHTVKSLRLARPRRRPLLTREHKRDRMQWARQFLERNFNWKAALFADEKVWYADGPATRQMLWQDQRDNQQIVPQTGERNVAVHFWGAFSEGWMPDLILVHEPFNSEEYCRILHQAGLGSRARQRYNLFHDRHPVHQSGETRKWLEDHEVKVEWFPAKGADMNPIENLWATISAKVYPQNKTYSSKEDLINAIKDAWRGIQVNKAARKKYVDSMPSRLQGVLARKSGLTKH